ncbi:FtsB family cell division protein [Agromyces mangrovi Wang et al. 2018]|uniref:FtsB family cell division protein n=1 Tax=Agromyces mangrovi TaxID=1858653 RepID=UPI0025742A94|nr:septum formation initiator family protein [Agromyces mangrovi]BDZ63535.1 hypothetical protein GCM10025877_04730 [Agromyces mangrovi]
MPESSVGAWLRGIRFSGFTVIMLALAVLAVVVLAPTLRVWAEQRAQIAALEADVAEQRAEVRELRAERERWDDRTFVMSQARDRLYYVLPGEVSYLVIDDLEPADVAEEAAPISTEVEQADADWSRTLLASLLAAGTATDASEGDG